MKNVLKTMGKGLLVIIGLIEAFAAGMITMHMLMIKASNEARSKEPFHYNSYRYRGYGK